MLLVIGFGAIEFPGIFFVMDKVEPFIMGMPFLYGYIFCWWLYSVPCFSTAIAQMGKAFVLYKKTDKENSI